MKVYVISDVHSDHKENMEWVEAHCAATSRPHDVLIIAGDVSDDLELLGKTLKLFASSYGYCFFCVGNHELWTRKAERGQYDSIQKLHKIEDLCSEIGVFTAPKKIHGSIWIVPIMSWYHADWDKEPDIPGAMPIERVMMDFHACSWTSEPTLRASGDNSIADYFDRLNDPLFGQIVDQINTERSGASESGTSEKSAVNSTIVEGNGVDLRQENKEQKDYEKEDGGKIQISDLLLLQDEQDEEETRTSPPVVISFSHFLPHQELLPEKRMLHYPNLAKASGSDFLATRILSLKPNVHIFGHTHFTQDQVINTTRCVQWPLGYPRDQARRRDGGRGWEPLVVYDSDLQGGVTPRKSCYWSDYYRNNERMPHIVDKAPWVVG
jgi:predicted phosphohydrolase